MPHVAENSIAEPLTEYVDSGGARLAVDHAASVLRGVKLLGLASRNGRQYRERALREAVSLYEGAKVNVNHPEGDPLSPRDYRDRIGVVRDVRLRAGEGLFGSLHYNPKHPLAEQLVWDAQHAPENVGLSHNVLARTSRGGSGVVVEAIDKVRSVDLVADPATTSGLFESQQSETDDIQFSQVSMEWLEEHRPDLVQAIAHEHLQQIDSLTERVEQLGEEQAVADRQTLIYRLLLEHRLPLPSEAFLAALVVAAEDEDVEQLVAEHAAALQTRSAMSREQSRIEARVDPEVAAAEFASSLKRRGC